jgi:hypothetical protein
MEVFIADFIPHNDATLDIYALNFKTIVAAGPVALGLTLADATQMTSVYAAWHAALAVATTPATRTAGSIAAKDTAKAVLITEIRSLTRRIQATPTVTAQQKTDLGIPVHDAVPSPVPVPDTKPALDLRGIDRQSHLILIADETTPTKKAKPRGAIGAEVYAFIGPAGSPAPLDLKEFQFMGFASKSEFTINYNAADANKQATIVARWMTRKGELGPISNPITGTIAA